MGRSGEPEPTRMWSAVEIVEAVVEGLGRRARALDEEQAVYGLDSLDELGLHPVIQEALRQAGWGIWPEERYPGDQIRPRRSQGKRCDVVLTPQPHLALRDPLAAGTLFAGQDTVEVEEAYWLEIKTVAQYECGGPFARYSAELLAPVVEDVGKLWRDESIRHGGLLLVLFTQTQETAEHDLAIWHDRCLNRGYPVATGIVRGFALTDRIGNGWCAAALYCVRGG